MDPCKVPSATHLQPAVVGCASPLAYFGDVKVDAIGDEAVVEATLYCRSRQQADALAALLRAQIEPDGSMTGRKSSD
jgi:hypothetical protein